MKFITLNCVNKGDFAAILLLDQRFQEAENRNLLPHGVEDKVETCEKFGRVVSKLAKFFEENVPDLFQVYYRGKNILSTYIHRVSS